MNKNIVLLLCLTILFCGCYKDKTKIGNKAITEIIYKSGISQDAYEVDKWGTLTITPVFSIEGTDKEVKYEWEIGHKIVSREPVLNYVCDTLGEFYSRLKLYNEDGATFKEFKVHVNSPYQKGLIISSNENGRGVITFKRTDLAETEIVNNKAIVDCFNMENPNVEIGLLGGVVISNNYIFVATKSPDKFVRANLNTFKATNYIEPRFTNVDKLVSSTNSILISNDNGKIKEYSTSDNAFLDFINGSINELGLPNISINKNVVYLYSSSGYTSSTFVFDDTNDKLIKYEKSAKIVENADFTGLTPHSFITCDGTKNGLFIFKNSTGKMKMYYYNYSNNSFVNTIDFSSSETVSDNSFFVAPNSIESNVVYSNDNKIYRFNYSANNIPTEAYITLEAGSVIKSIVFSKDNKMLYVLAYNKNSSAQYKSSLYCYDYETAKPLWKEDEIAGEAIGMILK